jgi:predicted anti-sigma-YlaC factor YlaD
MNCPEVREALPTYVSDGLRILTVQKHLAECEACSAELSRYERLLEGLADLQAVTFEPPPELAPALAAIPEQSAGFAGVARERAEFVKGHVARNRRAYVGGVGIALAGVAGAALWRSRTRHPAAA